jgi:hypothetical protein
MVINDRMARKLAVITDPAPMETQTIIGQPKEIITRIQVQLEPTILPLEVVLTGAMAAGVDTAVIRTTETNDRFSAL